MNTRVAEQSQELPTGHQTSALSKVLLLPCTSLQVLTAGKIPILQAPGEGAETPGRVFHQEKGLGAETPWKSFPLGAWQEYKLL